MSQVFTLVSIFIFLYINFIQLSLVARVGFTGGLMKNE